MIYLIILSLASNVALAIYIHKLKKQLEDKIDAEQCYRRQLEEFYTKLYEEYVEHYRKYH